MKQILKLRTHPSKVVIFNLQLSDPFPQHCLIRLVCLVQSNVFILNSPRNNRILVAQFYRIQKVSEVVRGGRRLSKVEGRGVGVRGGRVGSHGFGKNFLWDLKRE